jgi:hypothetical protein
MKQAGRWSSSYARVRNLAFGAMLLVPAAIPAQARPAGAVRDANAEVAAAKAALEKYRDPVKAIHDGYLSSVGCIDYPKGGGEGSMAYKPGAMGVHFLNLGYVGGPLAPDKPQVLIYEPRGDSLQLVAAEWFVPAQAVTGGERPKIFGRELEGPMMGHAPIMPEGLHHYDLHVWLWRDNPAGMFHPTNANVKCPKSRYTFMEEAPKMVPHGHKP